MKFVFALIASISCFLFALVLCCAEGIDSLKQYEYWDNNKIKSCVVYDPDGFIKAKAFCRYDGTVEKIERFDKRGNMVEEALYDEKGRLKTGIDGWAATRWWYEDSELISQISYDDSGHPMEKRAFSESGRLVFRQYRDDENLNPYVEASMAMLLGMGERNRAYYDPSVKPGNGSGIIVNKKEEAAAHE